MSVPLWCTLERCPLDWGYLHYRPSVPGNSFMLAAFASLTVPAIYLGIRHKVHLFTGCFMCGLLGEIAGYAGRIYLHKNPFNEKCFLVYLICTTIAPVFTAAAVYPTLARIVVVYGEDISRIRPRTYTLLFSGMDIAALVVQATGGGMAAVAYLKWKVGIIRIARTWSSKCQYIRSTAARISWSPDSRYKYSVSSRSSSSPGSSDWRVRHH